MKIEYRNATISDMKDVAACHKISFQGTFIATWPLMLIEKYYAEYLRRDNLFILATYRKRIIGFCMGYKAGSKSKDIFLKKHFIMLLLSISYRIILFDRIVLKRLWGGVKKRNLQVLYKNSEMKQNAGADLLSICVLPKFRRFGIAKEMITRFETLLTESHIADYTLSVYNTNTSAINFYKKQGLLLSCKNSITSKFYKIVNK